MMIQQMLRKAYELLQNKIIVDSYVCNNGIYASIRSFAVLDYITHILESDKNNYTITSGILCSADLGAPQNRNARSKAQYSN